MRINLTVKYRKLGMKSLFQFALYAFQNAILRLYTPTTDLNAHSLQIQTHCYETNLTTDITLHS